MHVHAGSSPTSLVVPIQIVLLSTEPKQPTMNVEVEHGNFFPGKWRVHHLNCPSQEFIWKAAQFILLKGDNAVKTLSEEGGQEKQSDESVSARSLWESKWCRSAVHPGVTGSVGHEGEKNIPPVRTSHVWNWTQAVSASPCFSLSLFLGKVSHSFQRRHWNQWSRCGLAMGWSFTMCKNLISSATELRSLLSWTALSECTNHL